MLKNNKKVPRTLYFEKVITSEEGGNRVGERALAVAVIVHLSKN